MLEELCPDGRVVAHLDELLRFEPPGFEDYVLRNAELADIAEDCSYADSGYRVFVETDFARYKFADFLDAFYVVRFVI